MWRQLIRDMQHQAGKDRPCPSQEEDAPATARSFAARGHSTHWQQHTNEQTVRAHANWRPLQPTCVILNLLLGELNKHCLNNLCWDHVGHHPDVSSNYPRNMLRMETMQGLDQSKIAALHHYDAVTIHQRTAEPNTKLCTAQVGELTT